jgi:hypothetical protein
MTIHSSAKTKVSIGTTATCRTPFDYQSDTYAAIDSIAEVGSFRESFEILKNDPLGACDRIFKRKTRKRDSGTLEVIIGFDSADAGQNALRSAFSDDSNEAMAQGYNFRLQLNDAPTSGTPTTIYFTALVAVRETEIGESSSVVRQRFRLEITSNIFTLPASAP